MGGYSSTGTIQLDAVEQKQYLQSYPLLEQRLPHQSPSDSEVLWPSLIAILY